MGDWDNIDRHLGPAEPAGDVTSSAPAPEAPFPPVGQERPRPAAMVPVPEAPQEEWSVEDEFNPRYCTVCHRKIPYIVSERQEMCDACLVARGGAIQPLPVTGTPIGEPSAPVVLCPMCASANVERSWKHDWVSTAVDIVADAASLGAMLLGGLEGRSTRGVDWNRDVGHVKVLRHRCLDCGHKWVE